MFLFVRFKLVLGWFDCGFKWVEGCGGNNIKKNRIESRRGMKGMK